MNADRIKLMNVLRTLTLSERIELTKKGKVSINDVRESFDLMPIEGGDVAFAMTPTGAVPLHDLNKYFHKPLRADDV